MEVVNDLARWWPLTLRQAYYRCVEAGLFPNVPAEYRRLSEIVAAGRMSGAVPWEAIEDRTRTVTDYPSSCYFKTFINNEIGDLLAPWKYYLNPMDEQPVALELWLEKDALAAVVAPVARRNWVPLVVARGNASVSLLHDFADRVVRYAVNQSFPGRPTRILYLGDLDPSGWFMFKNALVTLREEMDLGDRVQDVRLALNPEHIEEFNLPINPSAFKAKDPNARPYRDLFGDVAIELDALHPSTLQDLVAAGIAENLDRDLFVATQEREEREKDALRQIRETTQHAICQALKEAS